MATRHCETVSGATMVDRTGSAGSLAISEVSRMKGCCLVTVH